MSEISVAASDMAAPYHKKPKQIVKSSTVAIRLKTEYSYYSALDKVNDLSLISTFLAPAVSVFASQNPRDTAGQFYRPSESTFVNGIPAGEFATAISEWTPCEGPTRNW
ncbi:hypothetical protein [Schlesneria paludicola]|uniref:hypothetical protein n=1 Tax=Schlesneria paludicola TaxID=360056 RepID=UPI00029A5274|nr:hypothetical protein [Schlesneria paludicola]